VLEALLTIYYTNIQGLIIYDPSLLDSINVATTLAGQRDGIVVAPSQVLALQNSCDLPILADLRIYQWRNRLQAYRWAEQTLLPSASSQLVAGLAPHNRSSLRSFLVASRAFVYWLDSRDYLPNLDCALLSERSLMCSIFRAFPAGAIHLGWFIHESSGVALTSQAAMMVLASDYCSNLEVWTAVPSQITYVPQQTISLPTISNKVYLSFTISDGDNLQYCQHRMLRLWHDPARGSLPIGWTISPLLMQAAPALAAFYMKTMTSNDELVAGPSGAGYIFPTHWPIKQLAPFLQQTGALMQQMGITTLEVLDSNVWQSSGRYVEGLVPFGLQGVVSGAGRWWVRWKKVADVPLYQNLGLAFSVSQTVNLVRAATALHFRRPHFLNIYILAWSMTPSDLKRVVQRLGDSYEVILPKTLLAMLAQRIR
jgi:hypothetical protein